MTNVVKTNGKGHMRMCVITPTVQTSLKNSKPNQQTLLGLSMLKVFYKVRELEKLRQGNCRFKVSQGFLFKAYLINNKEIIKMGRTYINTMALPHRVPPIQHV